jgi:hypothetical protein
MQDKLARECPNVQGKRDDFFVIPIDYIVFFRIFSRGTLFNLFL